MTKEERASINNGIWLCQSCAKLIDNDSDKYTTDILKKWKKETEEIVAYNFGKRVVLNQKHKVEYIFEALRDVDNWALIESEDIFGYYFKENPSYKIEIVNEENKTTMYYSYLMSNESTSFLMLYIKYNETCIFSTQIVSLDAGRITTVVPLNKYMELGKNTYEYKYFIKNSKEIILRDFLFDYDKGHDNSEEVNAMKNFNEIVTEFESEEEKQEFENIFLKRIDVDKVYKYAEQYSYAGNNDLEKKHNAINIALGLYIKEKYEIYKENNNKNV